MIEYTYYTRVYYRDVDKMNIVYYSRYLEYFEAARTELMRSIELDVITIEKMGYFLPVISCHCEYQKSAKFDDELSIVTKINKSPRSSMKIEYEVYNSEKNLLVIGYTVHSFINSNGKVVKPPKLLIDKLRG